MRMVFIKCKQAVLRTDVVKRRGKCDTCLVAAEGPSHLFRVQSTRQNQQKSETVLR